jgi:hypothetical protein
MDHPDLSRLSLFHRLLRAVLTPRGRWALAWLAALIGTGIGAASAWVWARHSERHDRTHGHTQIDFGGQWVMARVLVEGHGRHLYDRNFIRKVTEKAYPVSDEAPDDPYHDVDSLLLGMIGVDAPDHAAVAASFLAPLAARTPLESAALLAAGQRHWTEERLALVTKPQRGGALYPPVHAMLFAPLACLPPRIAYRGLQLGTLVLTFVAGWALSRISGGRVWWPVAAVGVMIFPGYGGSLNIGQNAMLSLTLLMVGWWAMTQKHEALGGMCWGLLAYKPVWAVAFFPVLLLTQRWRAAAAMALTGAFLVLLTLPLVGWHSWLDWLAIGQEGAVGYAKFTNWVFLSRDLMGIPRRFLLHFDPIEQTASNYDDRLATALGRALQLSVASAAVLAAVFRPALLRASTGPGAAFALLSGWLCCFHFMYYDALLAALPVYLLFTDPLRYFDVRFWGSAPRPEALPYYRPSPEALRPPPMPLMPEGRRRHWAVNSLPVTVLVLISSLSQLAPLMTNNFFFPPFDTYGLMLLWGWCGWHVLRGRDQG